MLDATTIANIASLALTILAAALGLKWQNAKAKAEQVANLVNEIVIAAKDDKVTEEEFQKIVDAAKTVIGAM